jgi:hypothetical protein
MYALRRMVWAWLRRIVDSTATRGDTMTTDTAQASPCPNVVDGGLPSIAYDHLHNPEEAHRIIAQGRRQGPIAMGPHGPEVLSYELVRTVFRDPRFCMPKGLVLAAQGITSGRLWDKVTTGLLSLDGAEHQRVKNSDAVDTTDTDRPPLLVIGCPYMRLKVASELARMGSQRVALVARGAERFGLGQSVSAPTNPYQQEGTVPTLHRRNYLTSRSDE